MPVFPSKFNTYCRVCGKGIKTGEMINWSPAMGASHPDCQTPMPLVSLTEKSDFLMPWQKEHAKTLLSSLRKYGSALDASDTGTGKSYVAAAICKELNLTPAIAAPLAVIPQWQRVIQSVSCKPPYFILNYECLRSGNEYVDRIEHLTRVLKNGKYVDKIEYSFQWKLPPDTCLIFDEVQRCKSRDSIQGKLLWYAKGKAKALLGLSATAASNPLEMMNLMFALGLVGSRSDFWQWAFAHGVKKGRFGFKFDNRIEHFNSIHKQIFPRHGSRLRIANIPEFPETLIETDPITVKGVEEEYKHLEARLNELETQEETADTKVVEILRARQRVELLKVPTMVEFIEDALEENKSVVVFVNFRESIQELVSNTQAKAIHGNQTPEERQEAIDAFQRDELRVLIVQTQAGGSGLSLHDVTGRYPRVALLSPSYSAQDLRQCLGRVHRSGGKSKSIQRLLFAAGTVEEKVEKTVRSKLKRLDTLNDGDLTLEGMI